MINIHDGKDWRKARKLLVCNMLKGSGDHEHLSRINEIHLIYDLLQYVLMFPFSNSGLHCLIRSSYNLNNGVLAMRWKLFFNHFITLIVEEFEENRRRLNYY